MLSLQIQGTTTIGKQDAAELETLRRRVLAAIGPTMK
jgi:hypothetical protein